MSIPPSLKNSLQSSIPHSKYWSLLSFYILKFGLSWSASTYSLITRISLLWPLSLAWNQSFLHKNQKFLLQNTYVTHTTRIHNLLQTVCSMGISDHHPLTHKTRHGSRHWPFSVVALLWQDLLWPDQRCSQPWERHRNIPILPLIVLHVCSVCLNQDNHMWPTFSAVLLENMLVHTILTVYMDVTNVGVFVLIWVRLAI